jgi:hypothetical protein
MTPAERAQAVAPLLPNGGDRRSSSRTASERGTFATGNTADYLTARIARDRPDLLERMAAGEFRSVRAAALEAGLTARATTLRLDDASSAARTLRKYASAEFLANLVRELSKDQTAHR